MAATYYILDDEGRQTGPFTIFELKDIGLDTYTQIRDAESETWEYAGNLPEFYPYFISQGIYLPTGDNLASFGWRVLAWVVDYLILSFLMSFLIKILAVYGLKFDLVSYDALLKMPVSQILLLQLITCITLVVYNTICEASPMMGSVGKKVCKIVVVDIDGQGLTYGNALLRSAGKAISIYFLFYLGFISIFFTENKQALHDLIAKTYVIKL